MTKADAQAATERIVQSTLLQAWSRIAMAIGVPIILTVVTWGAAELMDVRRRITVIEAASMPRDSSYDRRLGDIERRIADADQEDRNANRRLGAIETSVAGLAATQTALLRTLERIERVLDMPRQRDTR